MANALVDGAPPSKKSKLSKVAPGGPKQDESKNVKKAKNAGHSSDEDRGFRAASALRTLMESRRIQKDAELMRDVKKHASEHMKSIGEVLSGPVTMSKRKSR